MPSIIHQNNQNTDFHFKDPFSMDNNNNHIDNTDSLKRTNTNHNNYTKQKQQQKQQQQQQQEQQYPLSPISRKTTISSQDYNNSNINNNSKAIYNDILDMERSNSSLSSSNRPIKSITNNNNPTKMNTSSQLSRRSTERPSAYKTLYEEPIQRNRHLTLKEESNDMNLVPAHKKQLYRESYVSSTTSSSTIGRNDQLHYNLEDDYEVARRSLVNPYHEITSGNNTIYADGAVLPTPSMLILQRIKGWKNIVHILHSGFKDQTAVEKQYAIAAAKNAHKWVSTPSLDRDVAFGCEDSSLTRFIDHVQDYSKDFGREHDEIYRVLSGETLPLFSSLEKDIDNKISSLGAQIRRREEILRKDSLRLHNMQTDLTRSLAAHRGTNATISVYDIGDPWLKNILLKKHLRAYINRFEAAHQSEESLDVNFEIWEKGLVESMKTGLTHYTTVTSTSIGNRATSLLRESLSVLNADEEWNSFYENKLSKSRVPDGPNIEYVGWDDPYCTAVREGPVLRQSKYMKKWKKVWWVITSAGWLHEFKVRPNLSGLDPIKPKRSFWLRSITLTPLGALSNAPSQEFHLLERLDLNNGKASKTKIHKYMTDSEVESESWLTILSHFAGGTLGFTRTYNYDERTSFRSPQSFIDDVQRVRERSQRKTLVSSVNGRKIRNKKDLFEEQERQISMEKYGDSFNPTTIAKTSSSNSSQRDNVNILVPKENKIKEEKKEDKLVKDEPEEEEEEEEEDLSPIKGDNESEDLRHFSDAVGDEESDIDVLTAHNEEGVIEPNITNENNDDIKKEEAIDSNKDEFIVKRKGLKPKNGDSKIKAKLGNFNAEGSDIAPAAEPDMKIDNKKVQSV